MQKQFLPILAAAVLTISAASAQAQTSVSTVPEGMMTINLPATGSSQNITSYVSLPLTVDPVYTGAVSSTIAVTANQIAVDDSPAPFVNTSGGTQLANLATASVPYFVKFTSGNEAGRILKITANTSSTLTLDTTDTNENTYGTPAAVALTTTNFNVQAGDSFEVFPGDTLASIFGDNTTGNPVVLNGAGGSLQADTVGFYNASIPKFKSYYFNTTAGYWELIGSSANANGTILYPYSTLTILRRSSEPALALTLMGRVPSAAATPTQVTGGTSNVSAPVGTLSRLIKAPGNGVIYDSTGFPVNVTLSQLKFGPSWVQNSAFLSADNISIWNGTRFVAYYQLPDNTWRKQGDTVDDQSSLVIPAGSAMTILQRTAQTGSAAYLQSVLPYSLQ